MIGFLTARARSLNAIAAHYDALADVCRELHLDVLSGDIQNNAQWAHNVNNLKPDYCPRTRDGAVLLTYSKLDRTFVIAALTVHGDGYFAALESGGNHDMSPGELLANCKTAIAALPNEIVR